MSTSPGWEPRPGPTRGDPARRAPRGSNGWARDEVDPRRQGGRGGGPTAGRGLESGPSFTPGRAPAPRDSGPGGPRAPRGGQGRPSPKSDNYDRRGPLRDDFPGPTRSSGEGPAVDGDRLVAGPAKGLDDLRPGGLGRWLGRMSTRTAILVLVAGTLLGVIVTLIAGQEPGDLLGLFIIVGTIAAALGIQRGKVYLLFPVPALAFFVAAVVTGKVHDAKLGSSTAGLGTGIAQWIAGIFFPAVVATILILLLGGGRWLFGRQLVTGLSPQSAGRPAPANVRPAPGSRRPAVDDWADDNAFDSPRIGQSGPSPRQGTGPSPNQGTGPGPRQGTGPTPRQGTGPSPRQGTGPGPRQGTGPGPRQGTGPTPNQGTGPAPRQGTGPGPRQGTGPTPNQGTGPAPRQGTGPGPRQGNASWQGSTNGGRPPRDRDQRTDRDPWGDPRLPADRSEPKGPRPRANGQSRQPPQPRDRPARPSWNANPNPPRPPRRPPPEGWTQR